MKPKIIFVASFPLSLINFRMELMQEFVTKGYSVIAIAPEDNEVSRILAQKNIQFITLPLQRNGLNPFTDFIIIIKLWKIFKKEKPDKLFLYTIKPVIYGSIAAKFANISQIYSMITGTGYVFLNTNLKSKLVGFIARKLFKIALLFNKLVFFQNKDNLDFFRQLKIISLHKPAKIINGSGVDCDSFKPVSYPVKLSFLMIARFLYDKGIVEYIEAARKIKQQYPHVNFKLVGWIDTNPNSISSQQLNDWITEGTIEYLGKLSDVQPAIAESSIYVLPSYHEGTPRTVLEAMAMARPVITTNAPGCKETVIPDVTGFLVPVKNIEKLYQAMEYFILSPEKIAIMGNEGRKLAEEKYDVRKVNSSILQAMLA